RHGRGPGPARRLRQRRATGRDPGRRQDEPERVTCTHIVRDRIVPASVARTGNVPVCVNCTVRWPVESARVAMPFTFTHAPPAAEPWPASSHEENVSVPPLAIVRLAGSSPSVGSVAPVLGSNVV